MGNRRGGYNYGKYSDYGWDYYSESTPRRVKDGIKAKSEYGAIGKGWWSKRWLSVLESLAMVPRLTRGRSYARQGLGLSLDVNPRELRSQLKGSLEQRAA